MTENILIQQAKETLEIRILGSDPDWKNELASRMMELSLQGWWYEAAISHEAYGVCYAVDIRFIRFRNGPNDTNIDADLIGQMIGFTDERNRP